jgi:hypothetical protein
MTGLLIIVGLIFLVAYKLGKKGAGAKQRNARRGASRGTLQPIMGCMVDRGPGLAAVGQVGGAPSASLAPAFTGPSSSAQLAHPYAPRALWSQDPPSG